MTATILPLDPHHRPHARRQRERRQALEELIAALGRSLDRHGDAPLMREAFEEMLRRIVHARSIQLRESAGGASSRSEVRADTELVALDVSGPDSATQGVLEATFDSGDCLGEWDSQMLRLGAHLGALVLEIERNRTQRARVGPSTVRAKRDAAAPSLIGSTPAMQRLRSTIERVASTDFTVLLEGESGVGKELVARQIHELSRRRHGAFVALNCAALVETLLEAELFGIEDRTATGVRGRRGKFELADGGTLFLDEVSDLSLSAQAKLLRVLQDCAIERVGGHFTHHVDIRIVVATNRSLSDMVARGLFRTDLFYRLSGVDVRVPTLRERHGDVLELANYFLERHRSTRVLRLSSTAAEALVSYGWPGNVRELERLVERTVTLASDDIVSLDDLPASIRGEHTAALGPSLQHNDTLRAWGSRYARLILDRCRGNKRQACRVLDISYHTLQAYLRYQVCGSMTERASPNREMTSGNQGAACVAGRDA